MALVAPPQPLTADHLQRAEVVNITPATVPPNAGGVQTFPLTGLDPVSMPSIEVGQWAWTSAAAGSFVQSQVTGIVVGTAYVISAGTLAVNFINTTSASATPTAGYYQVMVF